MYHQLRWYQYPGRRLYRLALFSDSAPHFNSHNALLDDASERSHMKTRMNIRPSLAQVYGFYHEIWRLGGPSDSFGLDMPTAGGAHGTGA
jgi:hypothetical protein